MDFLTIQGFNVRPGKNLEFQEWVRANTAALSNALPEGVELVGIYSTIFSSEKHSGQYRFVLRLDSYGAQDRLAGSDSPELARLFAEALSFGDVRLGADFSHELLKSVADVTIWADYPEE